MSMFRVLILALFIVITGTTASLVAAAPQTVKIAQLPPNTRELYTESMKLSTANFDKAAHLIARPNQSHNNARGTFMVRESSWYALGLLERDQPGDRALAATILHAVLDQQYRTPGTKWFGTFKRTPEEPVPALGTVAFTGYDPNWRQFIGTTFQMILIEYANRIPPALAKRLYDSIDLAVTGEQLDGRLKPTYSNIALMYGALWDFAAAHNGNVDWKSGAAAWVTEVNRLYRVHDSFFEYNSPTYYGVDLYGLALWRRYGSTEQMKRMGAEMEATLWNDIANYYHPELRNICGPYDRSYGMDMETYVAVTGVWLRSVLSAEKAPLPAPLTAATDHVADLWFAPQISILGTPIPEDALKKFVTFSGPHLITRRIDASRVATAWVGAHAMWGGEATSLTKDAAAGTQFHPATVQWRTPQGSIGWIRVTRSPKVNAVADSKGLTIETDGDITFLVESKANASASITGTIWQLAGLRVTVKADGPVAVQSSVSVEAPHGIAVTYTGVRKILMQFE